MSARTRETIDVVAGYDLWSAQYDALDNPLVAMATHAMDARAARFAGKRVIELGCGTGRNAARVLDCGAASYVGVDASRGMLDRARARIADARASFIEGRIEEASRAIGGEHDVILVSLVFEHVESLVPALCAARDIAADNAVLVAFELHPAMHTRGVRAHFRDDDRELSLPSFSHDENDFASALAHTGWTLETATAWYATTALAHHCKKLARYVGDAVLLEIDARIQ
jgi:ubiquinone/menaquinone biosynthesis C-methylase UbiE